MTRSLRNFLLGVTAPGHSLPWDKVDEAVKTGQPSTTLALGEDIWSYFANNEQEANLFAGAMSDLSHVTIAALDSYNFEGKI